MIRETLYQAIAITKMLDNQNVYNEEARVSDLITAKRFELEKITDLLELEGNWFREEIILLVNNIPVSDDLADEASTFGSIIANTGHFPLAEIWISEAFSEELDELKATMLGNGSLMAKDGCWFSFTKEVLTHEDEMSKIISRDLGCLSRTDINNILSISQLCVAKTIEYPKNYEDVLIASLKTTDYLHHDIGALERYESYLRDDGLFKVIEYFESILPLKCLNGAK